MRPCSYGPFASTEETNMSNSISTLLVRNLRDVFGENDPERRRAAVDEIYTEDVVFYDPSKGDRSCGYAHLDLDSYFLACHNSPLARVKLRGPRCAGSVHLPPLVECRGIPLKPKYGLTPISCHAVLERSACAPFIKERRMECINATSLRRKSGPWGTQSLRFRCRMLVQYICDKEVTS